MTTVQIILLIASFAVAGFALGLVWARPISRPTGGVSPPCRVPRGPPPMPPKK